MRHGTGPATSEASSAFQRSGHFHEWTFLVETNPLAGDRYRFTGREFDSELGLYYYRARYYDPSIGRFTTEDPIAFAGGDANLYRYVGNSPLTYVDPFGNASLVEYAQKLSAGPVGAILRTAQFQCFAWELGSWGISKLAFGDFTYSHNDTASLALAGISCTAFPTSAYAQTVFLALTETFYLYVTGASATEVGVTGLMHSFGIAGGSGLSRHIGKVFGSLNIPESRVGKAVRDFMADTSGSLKIPDGMAKRLSQFIDHKERAIAEYLENLGRTVTKNFLEGVPRAGRQGDAIVDGVVTEFKTLDPGAIANTIKNVVNNSIARGGQAREIVIDARNIGLTETVARQGVFKALGISRGMLDGLTVIGDTFFFRFTPR